MKAQTLPVFIFDHSAFEALDRGGVDAYDARFVVSPFPQCILRSDVPAQVIVRLAPTTVQLREIVVNDEGNGKFRVLERLEQGFECELVVDVDEALVRWTAHGRNGAMSLVSNRQSWHAISESHVDGASTARIVVGLLLALNHREVVVLEGSQPTRQQRRAAERKGASVQIEHHVRIPGDVIRYANAVARGRSAKQRAAHLVRAHIRHLGDGRITTVRSHARGYGRVSSAPIYHAQNVPIGGAE